MIAEAGNRVEIADQVRPRRKMGVHFIMHFYNSGQKNALLIFQKGSFCQLCGKYTRDER